MRGNALKKGAKRAQAGNICNALLLIEDEIRLVTCHMATGVMTLKAQDRLAWLHDQVRRLRYQIEAEAGIDFDRRGSDGSKLG